MLGYFRKNLVYRIISLLAAIMIWFFVFSERNPTTESVVTVPLEVTGLPANLVIAEKPNTVNIRFQGTSKVVNQISSRDFRAFISLEDTDKGLRTVQVQIEMPSGVRLVNLQPSWVQVEVDQVSSIQMPVDLVINGEAVNGYALVKPRITPDEVIIKGPEKHLENIGRVYVNASFNRISKDYFSSLPVLVEDKNNMLIMEWVEVTPSVVDVLIPVVEDIPNRIVPIVTEIVGELPPGLKLDKVRVFPSTVTIYGSRDIINETEYLTVKIDVSEFNETSGFKAELELPEGIDFASVEEVEVIMEVINEN